MKRGVYVIIKKTLKTISFVAFLILISLQIVGCSKENIDIDENIQAEAKLLLDGQIREVIISKSEGSQTLVEGFTGVINDQADLKIFRDILSSATQEEGKVKMMNPEFDLEIVYQDDSKQSLYLWLGKNGEISSLMYTDQTITRYSISADATLELINLIK